MNANAKSRRAATVNRIALLAAAIAALALLLAPAAAQAKPGIFWGAQIGRQLTGEQPPWDIKALAAFERHAGKRASLLAFYASFADCTKHPCRFNGFPGAEMEKIRRRGTIPFLSWSSASVGKDSVKQPQFRLRKIIAGKYDRYIREFAEASREWGHPYFLRFDWEMNGFWFPWNEGVNGNKRGEFVKAWRHVHRIFTAAGANNATWVWCPNIALIKKLKNFGSLYPGDRFVDWTCLDGFNWGKRQNSAGWQSFEHVFRSTYREVLRIAPGKPMILGETASEERGGSKARWIEHAFSVIPRKFRKIRGVIWFDERSQGMNWPIESSRASQRAFRRAIAPQIYRPNVYADLAPGPIKPPHF